MVPANYVYVLGTCYSLTLCFEYMETADIFGYINANIRTTEMFWANANHI